MKKKIFKKKINELKSYKGKNNELITYLIPSNKHMDDARKHIGSEIAETENIKSKQTRKSVKSSLKHIRNGLKQVQQTPKNGLAVFVGETDDKRVSEFIEPPKPLKTSDYRCGSRFHTQELEEMLTTGPKCGLIVISRGEASLGVFDGKNISNTNYMESGVPSKHKKGGFSQQRFERLNEQAKENFFKKVSKKANTTFKKIDKVIVGGHGKTKDDFIKSNDLDHKIKVIGKYSTNYTDESGLKELVDKAKDTLNKMELSEERELVNEFMKKIKTNEGLVAYGDEKVNTMIQRGAVDTLLISEDFDIDKIENLKDSVENMGGKVKIISTESNKGDIFLNTFGGIGAFLRYKQN